MSDMYLHGAKGVLILELPDGRTVHMSVSYAIANLTEDVNEINTMSYSGVTTTVSKNVTVNLDLTATVDSQTWMFANKE